MNCDIRLKISFPNHYKTKKLFRKLGAQGPLSLIYLWIYCAENRPDGVLTGMDEDDICIACQWDGDPQQFIDALLNLCLLQKQADAYVIHDWKENNPYAAHSHIREERARKGANAKWEKYYGKTDSSCSKQTLAEISNAPSPSPSPSPIKDKTFSASDDAVQNSEDWISRKKRKLEGKRLESFKLFWEAFDYKKGRAEAIDAWLDISELTNSLVTKIVEAAKVEAKGRAGLIQEGRTPKMAQGWLTARRWEDEQDKPTTPSLPGMAVDPKEAAQLQRVKAAYGN